MGVGPEAGKSLPLGRATDEEMDDLLRALDQTKEMKKATRSRRLKSARDLLKKCSLVDPKVDETSSPPGSAVVSAQCQGTADASYDVQARLKREEGEAPWVSKLSCSCVYFEKGEAGFCKHTIALLIWSCENLEKRWNASAQGTGKEAKAPKEEGSTKEKEEDGCMVRRKSEKKKPPGESEKLSSEKDDGGQEKTPSEKINQIVPDEGGWFTRRRKPAKDQGGDGGSAEKAKAEASEPSSDVVDDIFDEWLGFQVSLARPTGDSTREELTQRAASFASFLSFHFHKDFPGQEEEGPRGEEGKGRREEGGGEGGDGRRLRCILFPEEARIRQRRAQGEPGQLDAGKRIRVPEGATRKRDELEGGSPQHHGHKEKKGELQREGSQARFRALRKCILF